MNLFEGKSENVIEIIMGLITDHELIIGLILASITSAIGLWWRIVRINQKHVQIREELYQAFAEIYVSTRMCLLVSIDLSSDPGNLDSILSLWNDYPKPGVVEGHKQLQVRLNHYRNTDPILRREDDEFRRLIDKLERVTDSNLNRFKEIISVNVAFENLLDKSVLDQKKLELHLQAERSFALLNAYSNYLALLPPYQRIRERYLRLIEELRESTCKTTKLSTESKKSLEKVLI